MITTQLATYPVSHTIPTIPRTFQPAVTRRIDGSNDLRRLLNRFEPITLAEMDAVALLDRTDTKYVMRTDQLYTALAGVSTDYRVLQIDGVRLHPYETLYFDTDDFAMYMRHHAGRRVRFKVRSRQYVASQRAFMEVKVKTRRDRTNKRRIETAGMMTQLTPDASSFVAGQVPLDAAALRPRLWNDFVRVTLVSKHEPERLTLDLDLSFSYGRRYAELPGVAIAEVKQEGINRGSAFVRQMRAMAIPSTGFSKYCIGTALLYPQLKHNNFKGKLRLVEKLMGDDNNVH
ncbi:MAG: polyphosphate polymerase domain-containing protein [Anaerolineae bacterium]|nr:polyphosphate polymerase domain-containing protein [Anaerolineae bacterium]